MARGGKFFKHGLFTSNVLFLVVQIYIAVLTFFMVSKIAYIESPTNNIINRYNIVLVVNSCALIGLVLLGCCASVRGNLCCTITYAVFMGINFVLQTGMIIYGFHGHDKLFRKIDRFAEIIWHQRDYSTEAMDRLQLSFNCCGVSGFDDYLKANETIRISCCGKYADWCDSDNAFRDGCANAFSSFYKSHFETTIYVTSAIAVLELITFIFACCLAKQVRNKIERAI